MIQIGIVSDEISLDIKESIEIGLKLGIKNYELRCIGGYEKRVPYVDSKDIDFILKNVESGKINITALSPGIFKIRPSEHEKVKFELETVLPDTFKLARKLSVNKIIIFGFIKDQRPDDSVVEIIKIASSYAQSENFILAIENEPGFYCDTGENTSKIIKSIGAKNLGANWDPANAIGAGEFAYPSGYKFIKNYIFNLHIKDAVNHPEFKCTLIGDGAMNWFGQLKAIFQDGIINKIDITLETHHHPLIESTIENLKRLNLIIKSINELTQL